MSYHKTYYVFLPNIVYIGILVADTTLYDF